MDARICTWDAPAASAFFAEVVEGLSRPQKAIAPKWFYDAEGSRLFDAITRLPEYYVTRTEIAILREQAHAIAAFAGADAVVVEYGAGSGEKAALLLEALHRPEAYVCIEIEATAARAAARRASGVQPDMHVEGRVGDFTALEVDPGLPRGRRVGFFPGSTIGNFDPAQAVEVLSGMRRHLGDGARLLLGADQVKPLDVLLPAYDDAAGVTEAFNLNLLARMNRELGADFELSRFLHDARWNKSKSRIEMHLVSTRAQSVRVCDRRFTFTTGESIHTENSYKFDRESLSALVEKSGWRIAEEWADARGWFRVAGLVAA